MPTPHRPPPGSRRALKKLGADIRQARLRRRLTMQIVAERAATSRPSVARLEKGDPSVSIGTVAAVLQALNLVDRLADVAEPSQDGIGMDIAREELGQRASVKRRRKVLADG